MPHGTLEVWARPGNESRRIDFVLRARPHLSKTAKDGPKIYDEISVLRVIFLTQRWATRPADDARGT